MNALTLTPRAAASRRTCLASRSSREIVVRMVKRITIMRHCIRFDCASWLPQRPAVTVRACGWTVPPEIAQAVTKCGLQSARMVFVLSLLELETSRSASPYRETATAPFTLINGDKLVDLIFEQSTGIRPRTTDLPELTDRHS